MAKIGLFYGSTTGNTETAAETIQAEFGGDDIVELHNIADADLSELEDYDCLILGSPTWNIGELQSDWEGCFDELDDLDFSGKKVAYFGVGDQIGYADNFQDAMGILEEKVSSLGGQTVGHWPADGYDFSESKAVKNGKFIGLALDDDNQDDLTEERIQKWVVQLKSEFGV
ncbi:flavodoxin FldA [Baaleninema sp.]|uniref:flavodoxin FldA n=1 Tax=Baaleninema sp. TaxID=3101197 RepID=UPI003D07D59B